MDFTREGCGCHYFFLLVLGDPFGGPVARRASAPQAAKRPVSRIRSRHNDETFIGRTGLAPMRRD